MKKVGPESSQLGGARIFCHPFRLVAALGAIPPAVAATVICSLPVHADTSMRLGVQTHFAQGWPLPLMEDAARLGAQGLRDNIPWSEVEKAPGVYDFTIVEKWLEDSGKEGIAVLPVFAGAHPAYDGGDTPYTPEGRAAFARFVAATVTAFPDRIKAIEIGNEYNAPNFLSGPFEEDPPGNLAQLVAVVRNEVVAVAPETKIVCSGAHSVALEYFRHFFAAGGLNVCDALSLHPYRPVPEGLAIELAALDALMTEFGRPLPIHATEFGIWTDDPTESPEYMLKMSTILAATGVDAAYWYALVDEPWWPNMGLIDQEWRDKPAAESFALLSQKLLPLGRPQRIGDVAAEHIYAFGDRAIVAWGAPGALEVSGADQFLDSRGRIIPPPATLEEAPIVILGEDLALRVLREAPVYDSLFGFGASPWSYLARDPQGVDTTLELIETNWSPFLGNRYLNPLALSPAALNGTVFDGRPIQVVERFTAELAGKYQVEGRWWKAAPDEGGDGAEVELSANGRQIAHVTLETGQFGLNSVILNLAAGDTVDFAVGPNAEPGGDVLSRRIRVTGPLP